MTSLNILVAEDFAPFRAATCRELRRRPDLQVVTVVDGLAAVQKAEELHPDLVLLDIGLPSLDGLSAARRIRSISEESRIVFLTQESAPEIIQEAMGLGARGYICKTRARHLLPAVEAILEGKDAHHCHHARFYSGETALLEAGENFLGSALRAEGAAIAVTTSAQREPLFKRLRQRCANFDAALERGAFVHLDADVLVSQILSDGVERCRPELLRTIESAARGARQPEPRVAMFGETAAMLSAAGHDAAARELEEIGNELTRTLRVDIMCAYPLGTGKPDAWLSTACSRHGGVILR